MCYLTRCAGHRKVLALQDAQPPLFRIGHQDIDIAGEITDSLDAPFHEQLWVALERLCYNIVERFPFSVQNGSHHLLHALAIGLKQSSVTKTQEGERCPVEVTISPENLCRLTLLTQNERTTYTR